MAKPRRNFNSGVFAWHRYWVYKDPDFIEAVKNLPKRVLSDLLFEDYQRIAQEFEIRQSDVDFVHERPFATYTPEDVVASGLGYTFKIDKKYFFAKMNHDITKRQFLHLWAQLQFYKTSMGIKKTKNKPPENTQLLYAIFKARKRYTFNETYIMYKNKSLPYYLGKGTSQFNSEESLERYYRKYSGTDS